METLKSIHIDSVEEAEEIIKAAGSESLFTDEEETEKAFFD